MIHRAPLSYGSASSEDTGRSFYDVASAIIFQRDGHLRFGPPLYRRVAGLSGYVPSGDVGLFDLAAGNLPRPGRRPRAYDYLRQYVSVKDSLFEAQRGAQVAELRTTLPHGQRGGLARGVAALPCVDCRTGGPAGHHGSGWAVVSYRRRRRRDEQLSESLALVDSYRESHDSLTSRLDASDAREAAVKRLLEGA